MQEYGKSDLGELKQLLYSTHAHDAVLEIVEHIWAEDRIRIQLFNPIFHEKIDLTLSGVETVFAWKGSEYGSRETVLSLTIEEDFSYLETHLPKHSQLFEDTVYLLFQMFSGDELHIAAKKVMVQVLQQCGETGADTGRIHPGN